MPSRIESAARPTSNTQAWHGDYWFLAQNLILKDFRVRYRNMSLGVFWSLLNPLVMLGVLWFVFTKIFVKTDEPHYGVFLLCGLVPLNFFTLAWVSGTTSLLDNAHLIKRLPVPREVVPVASVLGNCMHLGVQIGLLIAFVFASGLPVHTSWLWLPFLWGCEIIFLCGISLITSCLNVYVRDIRYVVESFNVVLFWLVPIFYPFSMIADRYKEIYRLNPVAAMTFALRNVFIDGVSPSNSLLIRLASSSLLMLVVGFWLFRRLKPRFYNYL